MMKSEQPAQRAASHPCWTFLGSREVCDLRIFRARHDLYRFEPNGRQRDFVVLETPNWVNVVPVTAAGRVVLIRQYRHGIKDVTLEIPGGMIDAGERPEAAAARELREETGYAAQNIRLLGRVLPNPAFQDNYCYLCVGEGCRKVGEPTPDPFEHIEVAEHPFDEIPRLVRDGHILQTMVVSTLALMGLVEPVWKPDGK